ncbi:MAG: toll/interleukin-1 receptor domain-containing protein, partial [Thiobacillaceae bacterium]
MHGIFISYRRQDSQSAAGRLADSLKEHFPEAAVFRDVETIEAGVDFVDAINKALESCGVLLAVIGPRWISIQGDAGQRRLDDPNDYTRLELATALGRTDVRVIPVLVDGAVMPDPEALPEDLKPLARRNALELTDKRWDYDVSQLIVTLRHALGLTARPSTPRNWRWPVAGLAVLLVVVAGLLVWHGRKPDLSSPTFPAPVST